MDFPNYPGIYIEKAKHPDYSTFKARLETFNVEDDIDFSRILARCGFYSTGRQNCVRCFFCGECCRDLLPNENIWFRHAKCSPHCQYLKLHKGIGFIEKVLNMTRDDPMELDEEKDLDFVYSDQMIKDLNSRASQMMLNKEYKQSDVEQAIIKAREKHGHGELKSTQIFEWLLENDTAPSTSFSGYSKLRNTRDLNVESLDPEHLQLIGENRTEHLQLIEENRILKSIIKCKICMDKESCVMFRPCGHMVSCMSCASRLKTCAVCRVTITGTLRTYTG